MGPEIHSICVDRQINFSSECYSLTMGCFPSYKKWVWLRIEARWILMQTHPCVSSFEDKRHWIRLFTKLCSKLYQNHNGSCQAKWMPDNWVVDRQLVKAVSLTFGCWSSSIRQYLICYLIFLCIILYLVEGSFQQTTVHVIFKSCVPAPQRTHLHPSVDQNQSNNWLTRVRTCLHYERCQVCMFKLCTYARLYIHYRPEDRMLIGICYKICCDFMTTLHENASWHLHSYGCIIDSHVHSEEWQRFNEVSTIGNSCTRI